MYTFYVNPDHGLTAEDRAIFARRSYVGVIDNLRSYRPDVAELRSLDRAHANRVRNRIERCISQDLDQLTETVY